MLFIVTYIMIQIFLRRCRAVLDITKHVSLTFSRVNFPQTFLFSSTTAIANSQGSSKQQHNWVRSSLSDINETRNRTFYDEFWERSLEWGDVTAVECAATGQKYTYKELYRYSQGFATSLVKAGISNNATIGLVLPNIPEYPIAMIGGWGAGCSIASISPASTLQETLRKTPEGCLSFFDMIKTSPQGAHFSTGAELNMAEALAWLPFSSGTTGLPKGIIITHASVSAQLKQCLHGKIDLVSLINGGYQERVIGLLPFFHQFGAIILLTSLFQGAHIMTLPKFEPILFSNSLKKHQPSVLPLVVPLLNFLIQYPEVTKEELRDIHKIIIGATPVGMEIIERFLRKAQKDIFFQEVWGMTETGGIATVILNCTGNSKIGSCGTPVSNMIFKVADLKTGLALGPHENGEIHVKGPQIMKAYFRNENATNEVIDSEGWLHTGDIGYYDDSKYFYIVDRLKEIIKVKGFQVAPSELEQILMKHEDVADAAVIGVPHPETGGELPRAYIVLKTGRVPNAVNLHSFVADQVSSYKQLAGGIEFIDIIPKSASGEILRREL